MNGAAIHCTRPITSLLRSILRCCAAASPVAPVAPITGSFHLFDRTYRTTCNFYRYYYQNLIFCFHPRMPIMAHSPVSFDSTAFIRESLSRESARDRSIFLQHPGAWTKRLFRDAVKFESQEDSGGSHRPIPRGFVRLRRSPGKCFRWPRYTVSRSRGGGGSGVENSGER